MQIANKFSFALSRQDFPAMHLVMHFNGKSKKEYIKFIPVKKNNNVLDLSEKINRLIYLIFDHSNFLSYQTIPNNFIEKLTKDFNSKIINTSHVNKKLLLSYPKQSLVTNYRNLYIRIANFLNKDKTLIKSIPETFNRTLKSCAFCNKDTIKTQSLAITENFFILLNYAPFGGIHDNAHFMIVPKKHSEDWRSLNNKQLEEFYKISYALVNAIAECLKIPKHKTIGYLQNGLNTGQTVPHSHFHILHIHEEPQIFLETIKEQFYTPFPTKLSPDEITITIKKYRPIFLKYYKNDVSFNYQVS